MQPIDAGNEARIRRSYWLARVVGLSLLLGACASPEPPPPPPTPSVTASPNLVYENFTLTDVQPNGKLLWKLTASSARYDQNRTSASLEQVRGEFHAQNDRAIVTSAAVGSVFPLERRLQLEGQVMVTSEADRLQLQADRVVWLPEQQLLTAEKNVVIRSVAEGAASPQPVRFQVSGDRITLNFETNRAELTNGSLPVRATVAQPPIALQAERFVWQLGSELLTAQGGVVVQHQAQKLRLTGDGLTTQIPPRQVTLRGNAFARAEQTGLELRAEQMTWAINSTVVRASGNVRYRQPGQNLSVTGNAATANWQTNTVSISGPGVTTQLTLP